MGNKLYSGIEDDIKRKIINGELLPDEKLPTEVELIEMYNVSKITVRRALQNLIDDGYLFSIERVGFFVLSPNKTMFTLKFDPLSSGYPYASQSRIISCNTMAITEGGSNVVEITKLISCKGLDVCVEYYLLYGKSIRQEFTLHNFNEDIINRKIDTMLEYAKDERIELRVSLPSQSICAMLDIDANDPVMFVKISYYDEYERCYAHKTQYYIKESIMLKANLKKIK